MTTVYRLQFYNFEQQLVVVHIIDTTTTGDNEYTELEGIGFSRQSVTNEDIFHPIRAIEATIKFKSTATENINTFKDGDDNRWKVHAFIGAGTIFLGYLVTNDLRQPYFDDPNEVTLTATDNLGGLKDVALVDSSDLNPKGFYTLAQYLSMCFAKTGLELGMYISSNVYEEAQATPAFDSVFLQAKTFEDQIGVSEDCYSVIEKILRSLGCYVQQQNGLWYIISVDEMQEGNNTYHAFGSDGNYSDPIVSNDLMPVGSTENVFFINEDQDSSLRRANNFARLEHRYEYPEEIIDNLNYERGDFNGVVVPPSGYTAFDLDDWTKRRNFPHSGTPAINPLILRKFDANGYEIERFISIPATSTGGNTDYIESNAIPIELKDKFTWGFDFRFPTNISGTGMVTDIISYVRLTDGTDTYNLQNNGKWVLGTGFTITHQWNRGTTDEREWMTVSVEAEPAPISGNLYVSLLKSSQFGNTTDTYFANLNFDYIPYINGTYRRFDGHTNTVYTDLNKKPNIEDEVSISDPQKPLFKGTPFVLDGSEYVEAGRFYNEFHTPTPSDPADYFQLGKLQALMYWNQYRRPMVTLEGSLQGLQTNIFNSIPDCTWKYQFTDSHVNADNKIFMCVGFDQDFYTCEWKGTFVEVYDSTEGRVTDDDFVFRFIDG